MSAADIVVTRIKPDRRQLDDIAVVAARAFHFDPFFAFLVPPALNRARGLALFTRAFVASQRARGQIFVARRDERILGAAAWVEPAGYPLPIGRQLQQGIGALRALSTRPSAMGQGVKYLHAIDRAHPKEPLWYLALLVVDPSMQRAGIGGRLQQRVLDIADETGVDCYLETQNTDNLVYYRRFRYEVVDELHPVAGGPPLWTMRRAAKP
jgi:GNAT superfamily N-acetyltransferase